MILQYRFRIKFNIQENGCWIWTGAKTKDGYGIFVINGKNYGAHRVARYIYCGFNLDSEEQVLHKVECNNPSCINPDHTYEGDNYDNMRDIIKFGNNYFRNKTHCINGHEFTKENTYINREGHRSCEICRQYYREKSILRRHLRQQQ